MASLNSTLEGWFDMNHQEITKKIISWVEEIGNNKNFWNNQKDLGKTNIRSTAATILNAECYEEARLFIEYKTSRKDSGWDANFKDQKKFGEYIIKKMDEIYEMCQKNDKEALKYIAKFFGYLYWKIYGIVNAG